MMSSAQSELSEVACGQFGFGCKREHFLFGSLVYLLQHAHLVNPVQMAVITCWGPFSFCQSKQHCSNHSNILKTPVVICVPYGVVFVSVACFQLHLHYFRFCLFLPLSFSLSYFKKVIHVYNKTLEEDQEQWHSDKGRPVVEFI